MSQLQNEQATSTVTVNGEQAKQEITALAQRAETLTQKLKEANAAGDGKAFEKFSKQLKATQKEMRQLEKDSFDLKKVLNNLSGSSMADLIKAKKELDKQFNSPALQRNSKEWRQVRDDLRNVKKEISDLSNESKVGESRMSRMANGFNKYFAGITAGIAAITGLTMGLKQFMDMRNEVEDSKANLKALTGLGDEDIQWLRDYAKELSTTTTEAGIRITASAKEIMDGFTTIGSKRPELLKNKEAMAAVTKEALTLAAAGKMDVATAFDVVTASMNQFNLEADQSRRIINVIAAGSLEGSAEADSLAGSLKNVGTVANGSNMSLEDTIAMLEVLASKQLLGEEAGTKLRGALLKMKDAGVGYVSGAFNVRDAIIEINKSLNSIEDPAKRDAKAIKIFGAENITAGQILLENVEVYDRLRTAVTGTNVAYDQAIVQTNTVSARMAQAKNRFNEAGMELVKSLNPAILRATDFTANFLKVLIKMPKWLSENKGLLFTLAATMGTYTLALTYNTIAKKVNEVATKALDSTTLKFFRTLLTNPYVAIGAALATLTVYVYKLSTAQTEAQIALKDFNKEAATQQRELNNIFDAYKKANPETAEKARLLNIIKEKYGSYIQGLIDEKGNITDIEKAQRLANIALRQSMALKIQNASIDKIATDEIEKQSKYLTNIQEFIAKKKGNDIAGIVVSEIGRIYSENSTNLKKAYSDSWDLLSKYGISPLSKKGSFSGSLADDLLHLASSFGRVNTQSDAIKTVFKGLIGDADKIADKLGGGGIVYKEGDISPDGLSVWKNGKWVLINKSGGGDITDKEKKKAYDKSIKTLDDKYKSELATIKSSSKTENELKMKQLGEDLEYYKSKLTLAKKYGQDTGEIERQIENTRAKIRTEFDSQTLKSIEDSYKSIKQSTDSFENAEKQKLVDNYTTKKKFALDSAALEITVAEKRLNDAKEYASLIEMQTFSSEEEKKKAIEKANSEIQKAEESLTDSQKKFSDTKYSQEEEYQQKRQALIDKYGLENNTSLSNQYQKELRELQDGLDEKLLIQKEYEKAKKILQLKAATEYAEKAEEFAENVSRIVNGIQEAETIKIESNYDKRIEAARKAGQDTANLEEEKEIKVKEVKKKYADIDFAITSAKIIANTAQAVMKMWAEGGILGPALAILAGGAGLAELAVANSQRESIKNFYTGGFTDPGDKYEPRGIVHAGEFVANQEATSHAPLRRVFNLVDYAQRTNTVASISIQDIARSLGVKNGYAAGGYVAEAKGNIQTPVVVPNYPELINMLNETRAVNAALLSELKRGIIAKSVISGDDGVAKRLEDYNQLIKNAKG